MSAHFIQVENCLESYISIEKLNLTFGEVSCLYYQFSLLSNIKSLFITVQLKFITAHFDTLIFWALATDSQVVCTLHTILLCFFKREREPKNNILNM